MIGRFLGGEAKVVQGVMTGRLRNAPARAHGPLNADFSTSASPEYATIAPARQDGCYINTPLIKAICFTYSRVNGPHPSRLRLRVCIPPTGCLGKRLFRPTLRWGRLGMIGMLRVTRTKRASTGREMGSTRPTCHSALVRCSLTSSRAATKCRACGKCGITRICHKITFLLASWTNPRRLPLL